MILCKMAYAKLAKAVGEERHNEVIAEEKAASSHRPVRVTRSTRMRSGGRARASAARHFAVDYMGRTYMGLFGRRKREREKKR